MLQTQLLTCSLRNLLSIALHFQYPSWNVIILAYICKTLKVSPKKYLKNRIPEEKQTNKQKTTTELAIGNLSTSVYRLLISFIELIKYFSEIKPYFLFSVSSAQLESFHFSIPPVPPLQYFTMRMVSLVFRNSFSWLEIAPYLNINIQSVFLKSPRIIHLNPSSYLRRAVIHHYCYYLQLMIPYIWEFLEENRYDNFQKWSNNDIDWFSRIFSLTTQDIKIEVESTEFLLMGTSELLP